MDSHQKLPLSIVESQQAEIENLKAKLRTVVEGFDIVEAALVKSTRGHIADAPMDLDVNQARIHHKASAGAFQHALEMCGSTSITAFVKAGFVDAPPAVKAEPSNTPRFRNRI